MLAVAFLTDLRFPENCVNSPLVLLMDENTGSDGEVLCNAFKQLGLGTSVGRRTWGGVLGMEGQELVDGSELSMPDNNYYTLDVGFAVEGGGVSPDIEVLQWIIYLLLTISSRLSSHRITISEARTLSLTLPCKSASRK